MGVSIEFVISMAIAITIVESFAQNTLKHSHTSDCTLTYLIGLLFYVGVGMTLHYAYSRVPLGKMSLVWSSLSIITGITTGYFLYNETVNVYTLVAILFAVLALVFAQF